MSVVRAATPDDAPAVADIYNAYVTRSAASFETEPVSPQDMRGRIEGTAGRYPWLVAEEDGEILGYACASAFRPRHAYRFTVEVSIYLQAGRVGTGVGRRLYAALIATLERQGFTEAVAAITLPNDASVRMHEAAGFRRAGVYRTVGYKHGQWHDVGLWQRALAVAGDPPHEPRRFADVGVVLGG